MSALGAYLLMSLVFVFFTMVEFAVVLLLKEVNDRRLHGFTLTKVKIKSGKVISNDLAEKENITAKISPLEVMEPDLKRKGVTARRQKGFGTRGSKFFETSTVSRKIDFSAFVIYHFAYLIFNFIYFSIWI